MELTDSLPRPRLSRSTGRAGWRTDDFEAVFLEHYPRVVAAIRKILGDNGQAEEKADEIFLKLHEQPHLQGPEHNIGAWLHRAATRAGLDALRADARRSRYEGAANQSNSGVQPSALEGLLAEERAARVRAALAALNPQRAQLLLMRHSGFSYKDIAAALGLNPSSVGTLLARAESELARRYRQMHGSEDSA